jgi:Na+-transporting NADH:ubiquinone oxidoreductase subunit B
MSGLSTPNAMGAPFGAAWGRSDLLAIAGLVLPMAVLTTTQGPELWLRFAVVLVITLGLQLLFARIRRQPFGLSGVVTAGIIAIAVPAGVPLYQLLLGIVFGIVIGEQIFGGRGRSFLHPAIVTLAFLTFSFADQDYRTGIDLPYWTLLPALVLLVASGQASWRILVAAAGVLVLAGLIQGDAEPWSPLLQGSIVMALLYLAADPVSSAATNPGRWVYGLLVGGLAVLLATVGPAFGATVFAVLLASILAPLIDRVVIAVHAFWREKRHG